MKRRIDDTRVRAALPVAFAGGRGRDFPLASTGNRTMGFRAHVSHAEEYHHERVV